MEQKKAYKIELKPTEEQIVMIEKHFGCVRFVYNYLLANRIKMYGEEKKSSSAFDDINRLPTKKEEYEWVKEVDSTSLQIKNMLKNHHLARSISSVSWGEFVRMLEYKCKWYGKELVKVAPHNTSKTCSNCGYMLDKLKLSTRE